MENCTTRDLTPYGPLQKDKPMLFDRTNLLRITIAFILGGSIAFVSAEYSAFVPVVTVLVLVYAATAAMKWVKRSSKG
jgi:hypothetical protein